MADFDFSEFVSYAAELAQAGPRAQALARLVIAKAANDVQAEAQRNAPVDTGFLRGSISVVNNGLEFEVGPTAHYGLYVEMGTSRMAAQPYLYPALDRVMPGLDAAMAQVIDGSLG